MLLLLWPGARVAIRAATGNIGARIVGGTFTRGRWRAIQEEKARLIREAEERRRRKRERERKERERVAAFEAALEADAARHEQELARLSDWASLYGQTASGVGMGANSVLAQAQLAGLLKQNSRRLSDDRDERELIEALFAA